MSDTNDLLILGLVRLLQPVHGYEVRRELLSWGADEWGGMKPGSIYHGLKRLSAKDLLQIAATERVDNRPERTSYRITARGEAHFQQLLRQKLWTLEPTNDPFFSAWSFLPVVPAREAAAMLRNRAAMLRDRMRFCEDSITHSQHDDPTGENFMPRHVAASLELSRRMLETNAVWCEEHAELVEAGELYSDSASQAPPAETVKAWKEHINTLDKYGQQPRQRRRSQRRSHGSETS